MRRTSIVVLISTIVAICSCSDQLRRRFEDFEKRIEIMDDVVVMNDERLPYFQGKVFPGSKIICGRFVGHPLTMRVGWFIVLVNGQSTIYTDNQHCGKYEAVHICNRPSPFRIDVEYRHGVPTIYVVYRQNHDYYYQVLVRHVLDYGIYQYGICVEGWLWRKGQELNNMEQLKEKCR